MINTELKLINLVANIYNISNKKYYLKRNLI